jgi:phosphoenolpyruvate-protein kinase (PTS system EI component)
MAGEPRYTALLLALGLTSFSMHPQFAAEVREPSASAIARRCAGSATDCCAHRRAPASSAC